MSERPTTPMMQQYLAAKQAHPDCLLFFRMGDFYEMFLDDAIEASRILNIALTTRDKGREDAIPMCGVPWHSARGYLQTLLAAGRKVAICEQVEDPRRAQGIVRREVVQVVSPGVILDLESLEAGVNNFLVAVWLAGKGSGIAYADVSTAEFFAARLPERGALEAELARLEAREIVVAAGQRADVAGLYGQEPGVLINELEADAFDPVAATARLAVRHAAALEPPGLPAEALRAAGALLAYLERTQASVATALAPLQPYDPAAHMTLAETARAHLEVARTLVGGQRKGSLLSVIDQTRTAMGARRLRQWLTHPLVSVPAIERRLDRVQALCEASEARAALRAALGDIQDLERLTSRVAAGASNARDLVALRRSLEQLPAVVDILAQAGRPDLRPLADWIAPQSDIAADIARALVDDPPLSLKDGGLFRAGYDETLDELIHFGRDSRSWLLQYEAGERKRAGIPSLKVRFNKVFGYYIEVTKPHLANVPDDYIRKQTIATGERFFTTELKEFETKSLTAQQRQAALEETLFEALRTRLAGESARLIATARAVAELDALAALAEVAQRHRYVRPRLDDSRRLRIVAGRHPVVEAASPDGRFVANDVELDADDAQLLIITGPNMAGKSTVMRQVALIALLAQAGSFVPADEAHIGVVDRIFTRVGASDELAAGRSTFMVEMSEAADILRAATPRSLIILDEIGRGTSTFDGLSIAWAVAEHLHDEVGARTMFATHYHELTDLARTKPRVRNFNIAVKEWQDQIVFLRQLVPGGTNRSYGIQVARLAGLPAAVVDRAKEILQNLETGELDEQSLPRLSRSTRRGRPRVTDPRQLDLFAAPPREPRWARALRDAHLDGLTPLDALRLLYELQSQLRADEAGEVH